jgi:hypothetical protein
MPCIIYPSVLASEASTSDCEELSKTCEQWLWWRSKPSASRTWSQRWKRVNWMQRLYTRIFIDSHGQNIEAAWISSLAASRANRSARPEVAKPQKTQDTSGPLSKQALLFSDPALSSSRMSMESCPQSHPDTTQFSTMSSATWKAWVSERRQNATQRRKSARHTCGDVGSSSLFATPTVTANQMSPSMQKHPGCANLNWPTPTPIHAIRGNHDEPVEKYMKRVEDYEQGRAKGKPGKSLGIAVRWPTATTRDWKDGNNPSEKVPTNGLLGRAVPRDPTSRQGQLNPEWVDMLMGFPTGWTDLEPWATR